jgi:hypothetical protein
MTTGGHPVASVDSNCPADEPLRMLFGFINDHDPVHFIGPVVIRLLDALVIVVLVVVVGRLLRGLVDRTLERASHDRQLRILARNLFNMTTLMIVGLAALSALGLSVSVVVTSLGLTGLVVGLALQDLLRNVLAGIFLLVERPFRIGNAISVGDLTVESIELRTTGIRTVDGRLAIMPNLNAFNGTVINSGALPLRRCTVSLSVPPGRRPRGVARSRARRARADPGDRRRASPAGGPQAPPRRRHDPARELLARPPHARRERGRRRHRAAPPRRIGGMACPPAPLAQALTGSGARPDPAVAL